MPRKRKPTQSSAAAPGQVYGQGVDQTQAMNAVPLADVQAQRTQAVQTSSTTPPPTTAAPAAAPSGRAAAGASFAAALEAARRMSPPQGMLQQALADPSGVSQVSPSGMNRAVSEDLWVQLAEMTGDPSFLRLAQQARMVR